MPSLAASLEHAWYAPPRLTLLLLPLEWLFIAISTLRRRAFQSGWLSVYRPPCTVVVVGNLLVGGTGKTPIVIALARALAQRGHRVGVVARGYGGAESHRPRRVVSGESTAAEVGDEALLIADATDLPVVVCRDRSMAVRALVADGVDIVISDDGLQHYALDRDFEIVAMDSARGFGNGHRLPVGPLRESPSRLATVDWVLQRDGAEAFSHCPLHAVAVEHLASGDRHALDSATIPRHVNAVAGIGNPDAFFDTLRDLGFVLESQRAFPDHHPFTATDVAALGAAPLIMTAKDAVKCRAFAGDNHWCLHVEAALPAGLVEAIEERAAARSHKA